MVTLAYVPDNSFLLVWVALSYLFACWPSNSGPSGPVSKSKMARCRSKKIKDKSKCQMPKASVFRFQEEGTATAKYSLTH